MKRRDFCKNIGMGSAALASYPHVANALVTSAEEDDEERERKQIGFRFVSVSKADPVGAVVPLSLMNCCGTLRSSGKSRYKVDGGGSYDLIDNASPVPKTILGAGKWEAERVRNFNLVGTYGVLAAGILELDVKLLQEIPSRDVFPATLRIACSLAAAGLDSGEPEGYVLTIADSPFGPFRPIPVAPVGVTVFTIGNTEE